MKNWHMACFILIQMRITGSEYLGEKEVVGRKKIQGGKSKGL
jgi:hypothetical protein